MKKVGILLILIAVCGGGFILAHTIPSWRQYDGLRERARADFADATRRLEATMRDAATEREIATAVSRTERARDEIRLAEDGIAQNREETLVFGGAALAVLGLGAFLVQRGRRKTRAGAPAIVAAGQPL